MNNKLTGKPKHLFMVKEDSPAQAGRMLSAESLSADQQLTAKRYIGLSPVSYTHLTLPTSDLV